MVSNLILTSKYLAGDNRFASLLRICQIRQRGSVKNKFFIFHNSSFCSKNNRKLHSLLLPSNLNLNYENFVFGKKVLLFYDMTKF